MVFKKQASKKILNSSYTEFLSFLYLFNRESFFLIFNSHFLIFYLEPPEYLYKYLKINPMDNNFTRNDNKRYKKTMWLLNPVRTWESAIIYVLIIFFVLTTTILLI